MCIPTCGTHNCKLIFFKCGHLLAKEAPTQTESSPMEEELWNPTFLRRLDHGVGI